MPQTRVITPEAARAAGISPASLRQVAAWNVAEVAVLRSQGRGAASKRCAAQAAALNKVVAVLTNTIEPETVRSSRRRAA